MKFCWHIYELYLGADWKQIVLEETENGRWIRNLHPHKCIKCGKTKWWHFGKEWVWKGQLSFVEQQEESKRWCEELRKQIKRMTLNEQTKV